MKQLITSESLILTLAAVVVLGTTAVSSHSQEAVKSGDTVTVNSNTTEKNPYSPRFSKMGTAATRTEDPAAPTGSTYNWSGFYIGGHAGYGWGNADTNIDPLPSAGQFVNLLPSTLKPDPRGFLGGAQGGYNWQKGHLVIGAEADISWTDLKGTKTVTPIPQNNGTPFPGAGFITVSQKTSYLGTIRPRLGVAFGKFLLYGTFGLAYGRVNYSSNVDFRPVGTEQYPVDLTKTKIGTGGGFGGEVGLTKHISWKVEVLFTDLQKESVTANPVPPLPPFQVRYRWETQASIVNSGINFRF